MSTPRRSASAVCRPGAGLVDDAAVFPPGNATVPDAVAAHREHRRAGTPTRSVRCWSGPARSPSCSRRPAPATTCAVGLVADANAGWPGWSTARDAAARPRRPGPARPGRDRAAGRPRPRRRPRRCSLDQLALLGAPAYVEVPRTGYEARSTCSPTDGAERAKYRTGGPTRGRAPVRRPSWPRFLRGCARPAAAVQADRRAAPRGPQHAAGRASSSTASSTCSPPSSAALGRGATPRDLAAAAGRPARPDAAARRPGRRRRRRRCAGRSCRSAAAGSPTRSTTWSRSACWTTSSVTRARDLGRRARRLGVRPRSTCRTASSRRPGERPRCGVRIGDQVLDLGAVSVPHGRDFTEPALNTFLARGRAAWAGVRERVTELLSEPSHRDTVAPHLHPLDDVTLQLPWQVADYVDFYSSEQHAAERRRDLPAGRARPAAELEAPADRLPRPRRHGRRLRHRRSCARPASAGPAATPTPTSARAGGSTSRPRSASSSASRPRQGTRVPAVGARRARLRGGAAQRLVRARHPGLGVPAARPVPGQVVRHVGVGVGDPARRAGRGPGAAAGAGPAAAALPATTPTRGRSTSTLEVELDGEVVSRPPFAAMYWTPGQQLAHLTVNGASLRTGDLFASGTVSGAGPARARLVARAVLGRPRAADAAGRARS